jgi:hypothetical protein
LALVWGGVGPKVEGEWKRVGFWSVKTLGIANLVVDGRLAVLVDSAAP